MKEYAETHQQGTISVENLPEELSGETPDAGQIVMGTGVMKGDLGIQIAKDGRVWICINGIAFLRFSPHPNGKMKQ